MKLLKDGINIKWIVILFIGIFSIELAIANQAIIKDNLPTQFPSGINVSDSTFENITTDSGKELANVVSDASYVIVQEAGTKRDCGVVVVKCTKAINGSTWIVDYSGTDSGAVLDSVISSSNRVSKVVFGKGTFSNLNQITSLGSPVTFSGLGQYRTILQANPNANMLFDFRSGTRYKIEDMTIDCSGILTCINTTHTSTGAYPMEFNGIWVHNATTLMDFTNSEEMVIRHSVVGAGTSDSSYGVVVRNSGGNMKFYDTLFQNNSVAGVDYQANTQISFFSPTFTQGGSKGQLYINSSGAPRVFLYEPWFEKATGDSILSLPTLGVLSIDGGYFSNPSTSKGYAINGSIGRLNIKGSPTIITSNGLNNINITTNDFYVNDCVSLDTGINNQEGNSTRYSYRTCGSNVLHTNVTFPTSSLSGTITQGFQNLVVGGFESWSKGTASPNPPDGWTHSSNGYNRSNNSLYGNSSFNILGNGITSVRGQVNYPLYGIIKTNTTYTVGAWLNMSGRTSAGTLNIDQFSAGNVDTSGIGLAINTDWTYRTSSFNLTTIPTDLVLRMFLGGTADAGENVYVDGLTLMEGNVIFAYSPKPLVDDGYSIQINSTDNNVTIPNAKLVMNGTIHSVCVYPNLTLWAC